jgi:hypothetical protein
VNRRNLLLSVVLISGVVGLTASAAQGSTPASHATISLKVAFTQRDGFGRLSYRLDCDPQSGTMPHLKAVCAAIARHPGMVPGGPRHVPTSCLESSSGPSIPPLPASSVTVTGTDHGRQADGIVLPCFKTLWLSFLPTALDLDRVRVDRGLGPLQLGQSASSVRQLLGQANEERQGLHIYRLGIEQVTFGLPVIFAVGYGHSGRVTTLIYNTASLSLYGERPTVSPGSRSRRRGWLWVGCGGHHALADHRPVDGKATTIIRSPIASISTVIVSSMPDAACMAATRTAPQALPLG